MDVLTIGSPAPDLRGVRWLQGDPVTEFEPGQLYVVEFWSTWCGPCRATIPKLSKLAAKFAGKVTVVGVDVFEESQGTESSIKTVEEFVAKMGQRMTYRVLIDGEDRFMAEEWMRRSGRQGIPSAFVVDGEGKISWIGHPASGLEKALSEMIAGTYLPEPGAAPSGEEAQMAETMKVLKPFLNALQAGDFAAATAAIDELAKRPDFEEKEGFLRFQAAAACRQNGLVREYLSQFNNKSAGENLWVVASMLGNSPGLDRDIYLTAIELVEGHIAEGTETRKPYLSMFYEHLANLYGLAGAGKRAIELTKYSIEQWREAAASGEDGGMADQMISRLEMKLEEVQGG